MQTLLQLDHVAGKKGSQVRLEWTEEQVAAFHKVKELAAGSLELYHANPDRPFAMRCDASDFAIGAVLEQRHPNASGKACDSEFLLAQAGPFAAKLVREGKGDVCNRCCAP